MRLNNRIFFYDRNLRFYAPYHTYPAYKEGEMRASMIEAPDNWAVFHYAYLDKKRREDIKKDIKTGKRDYGLNEWDITKKIVRDVPENFL